MIERDFAQLSFVIVATIPPQSELGLEVDHDDDQLNDWHRLELLVLENKEDGRVSMLLCGS